MNKKPFTLWNKKKFQKASYSTGLITTVLCFILQFSFLHFQSKAQCWQWAVNSGGTGYEISVSIAVDNDGNSYITGEFDGTAIFGNDTIVSEGFRNIFAAMLDSNGNVFGAMGGIGSGTNIGTGIAVDMNGNVYITGYFRDTVTFGSTQLISAGSADIFIVKYDTAGNLLWAQRAGGTDLIEAHDIAVDNAGNCYIIGDFYGTANFGVHVVTSTSAGDVFTVKYDANGTALWAASCGSNCEDIGTGITVDTLGNVYITGYFHCGFIFNSIAYGSAGIRDIFIAKYDPAGNPGWASTGGGGANDFSQSIAVDADGNIYISGEFDSDTAIFGNISLFNANNLGPRSDIFLVKYDTSGLEVWAKRAGSMGNDYSNDIAIDSDGNIYMTGTYKDTITFGSTIFIGSDMYIVKYNGSGTVLWAQRPTYNSAGARSYAIALNSNNKPYITGYFSTPSVVFGSDTLYSNGSLDVFVAKIGPPCNAPVGIDENFDNYWDLKAYPNPFEDKLNIQFSGKSPKYLGLKLYNLQGQQLIAKDFYGQKHVGLEMSNIPAGIYILQLITDNAFQTIKIIKMME
ncbi:MAG: SBBP repeat-containing protein [Bacteroidetes bacterium]|nr:SBBP repeat-containing protein [Bacteroidota bacterium]